MFDEILTKIFGSRNDRLIKQYRRKVEEINGGPLKKEGK